jgi:mRNA interferase MazF
MKRGEVWWVAFGPSQGGEVRKERPALIISNDASNRHLNRVQVAPLTSNVERVYPSEALVEFAGKPVKVMADQLTTVSKARVLNLAGHLTPSELQRVERAIMVQLGLGEPASART